MKAMYINQICTLKIEECNECPCYVNYTCQATGLIVEAEVIFEERKISEKCPLPDEGVVK